jgi:hypothetical protein
MIPDFSGKTAVLQLLGRRAGMKKDLIKKRCPQRKSTEDEKVGKEIRKKRRLCAYGMIFAEKT